MVRNLRASWRSSRGIKYQFGVRVPRNIAEAYQLDEANGNSLWTEAIERKSSYFETIINVFELVKNPK